MINFYRNKTDLDRSMWFGVNGYRFNSKRRSPSRGCYVRDIGWMFIVHLFGYDYVIMREKTVTVK